MVPDYRIEVGETFVDGEIVVLFFQSFVLDKRRAVLYVCANRAP